jgi:hypothetical protein
MDNPPRELESSVMDLTDWSLEDLRNSDFERFLPSAASLLRQVFRPRANYTDDVPTRID